MAGLGDVVGLIAGSTPQGALATVAAGAAEGLLSGLGTAALKIREAIKGKELDPTVRAQLEAIALQAEANAQQGQIAVQLEEAKSGSLFVAGWRPYVGWVCGSVFAYALILQPFVALGVQIAAWLHAPAGTPFPALPVLDTGSALTVLLGLLGLGGMRTFEKVRGVTANH